MDILTNKQTRKHDYLSRYTPFYLYYNTIDKKYIYGITSQISSLSEYSAHKVETTDTLDSLALKYYGRPDYYWVIADYNRIQDPFITLYGKYKTIKIPSLSTVGFEV